MIHLPSAPYTPAFIARLLRDMPADRLAATVPHDFHRWPTRKIVPAKIIRDLISNERDRRRASR
jgi:hypothetical protein